MPRIGDEILDTAFYLYPTIEDAKAGRKMGGSGFLVSYVDTHQSSRDPPIYAVTNRHVAVDTGNSVVRLNCKDGTTDSFVFDSSEWQFIPGGPDVAAVHITPDPFKHKFSAIRLASFVPKQHRSLFIPEVGEDVFMVGRLMDHDGGEVNLPAVRFGNISVMPTIVRVNEQCREEKYYCVDLHSRNGFSGSPVFAYRTLGSDLSGRDLRFLYDEIVQLGIRGNRPNFYPHWGLLGIHCGQFPEELELRRQPSVGISKEYVVGMSGMTLVAPSWAIEAVLNTPRLQQERAILADAESIPEGAGSRLERVSDTSAPSR